MKVSLDIGRVLKDSWAIFAKDWGPLILGALITLLLGIVTLGFLFVPLLAGLYFMVLRRVREGRKAEIRDVFGCFDRLGAYVVAYLLFIAIGLAFVVIVGAPLLLLVIPNSGARAFGVFLTAIAAIAAFAVAYYLQTVWVYWTVLMVDRRLGVVAALAESRVVVTRSGFWMTLLIIVIVGAIVGAASSALGAVTFGIGSVLTLLTMPWQIAAYTAMYFQATGEDRLLPSAYPGASSIWLGGGFFAAPFQAGAYPPPYASPYWAPGAAQAYPPPYAAPGSAPPYTAPGGPSPYAAPGSALPYAPPYPWPPQGAPGARQTPQQTPPWQGSQQAPPWQTPQQAPPWTSPQPGARPAEAQPFGAPPFGQQPSTPPADDRPGSPGPTPPEPPQAPQPPEPPK